jgi:hypothetical protein
MIMALGWLVLASPVYAAKPTVLFWAGAFGHLDARVAQWLVENGFEVQWGEPTAERLQHVNVLVLLDGRPEKNLDAVLDFVKRGGGLFIEPLMGQSPIAELKAQYPLFDALGLVTYPESLRDANAKTAGPVNVSYSLTRTIAPTPVSEGVTSLWLPVGEPGGNTATMVFDFAVPWQTVVTANPTTTVTAVHGGGVAAAERLRKGAPQTLPVFGIRAYDRGRVAACGVEESFLFADGLNPALGVVAMRDGTDGVPSHAGVLALNTLRWLAAPSLGKAGFGGGATDSKLLQTPGVVTDVPFRDWSKAAFEPIVPSWHGVVGARTKLSTGAATPEAWVAAAKKANLQFIVFLEDFDTLTKDKFAMLQAECKRLSNATFQAYPGFTIQDVYGNHYFACGSTVVWPDADLLDATGKRFTDVFQGGSPEYRRAGTLGAVLLEYWLKRGNFSFGTWLQKENPLPYYDFRAYDALAVVTQQGGKTLESFDDMLPAYQHLTNRGEHLRPFAITLMDDPADLRYVTDGTYYHMVFECSDVDKLPILFCDQSARSTMPPFNRTIQITNGPVITEWKHVGDYDWRDYTAWDWYRWDHYRWRLKLAITSADGLKDVKIIDGYETFRRFLPNGQQAFTWESDLTHNQQHNLYVLATDTKGHRALTTELFDRAHLFEEYMCQDRMNQLTWGKFLWDDTHTGGLLAVNSTPWKGPFGCGMVANPAGRYGGDPRLGALQVWGFDGGATAPTPTLALVQEMESDQGKEPTNWGPIRADRVLHGMDVHIGSGSSAGIYALEKMHGGNLTPWESMGLINPSKLFDVTLTHASYNVRRGGLGTCELVDMTVTIKKDQAVKHLWLARGGTPKAARDGEQVKIKPDDLRECWLRTPGDYVFWVDKGGSQAVFNLGTQPLVVRNGALELPVTTVKAGDTFTIKLLVVGAPYTAGLDQQWIEDVRARMGLAATKAAYTVKATQGTVLSQAYLLTADGQGKGFAATLTPDKPYPVAMPIVVTKLNQNWTAVYYEPATRNCRPLSMSSPGTAYVAYDLGNAARTIFIGHPFVCDKPDISLTVTQTGPAAFTIEVHNPTDTAHKVTIKPAAAFTLVTAAPQTLTVPAGSSTVITMGK